MSISGKRIAILATHGFEQSELEVPMRKLKDAGAQVDVVSLQAGEIKGWAKTDWGRPVPVDKTLDSVSPQDYDAVVLPGGQINPDLLRVERKAIDFIKGFWRDNKVVGAICHAPWLLIEAGIVKGRRVTSYKSIKTDVINAGGRWEDSEVVTDQGLVTSRNPGDLDAFSQKLIEEIGEGVHQRGLRGRSGDFGRRDRLAGHTTEPGPPLVLAAVEYIQIDAALDAVRKPGSRILPEHPFAVGIDL
jgi:protease I